MITRRDLIVAAISAGATSAICLMPWPSLTRLARPSAIETGLGEIFDQLLAGLDGTRAVGQAFVQSNPTAPSSQTLAGRLAERLGSGWNNRSELEAVIANAVKEDFSSGQLCRVDGWLLSQTECELAGLRWQLYGDDAAPPPDSTAKTATSVSAAVAGHAVIAEITNWGPRSTEQGSKFNVQPDGHSGLWFTAENVPSWVQVRIDGAPAPTTVSESGFTSGLFGEMQERILSTPGRYAIELHDPMRNITQPIGELEIRPLAERALLADGTRSKVFCPVTNWGPQQTRVGVAENPQPDGSEGMWFLLPCAPARVQLVFGDDRLPATRTERGVTSRVPLALLESAGQVPLKLRDVDTGEELDVGRFDILPQ